MFVALYQILNSCCRGDPVELDAGQGHGVVVLGEAPARAHEDGGEDVKEGGEEGGEEGGGDKRAA